MEGSFKTKAPTIMAQALVVRGGEGTKGILNFYNRTFCGPQTSPWASTRYRQELHQPACSHPAFLGLLMRERGSHVRVCGGPVS